MMTKASLPKYEQNLFSRHEYGGAEWNAGGGPSKREPAEVLLWQDLVRHLWLKESRLGENQKEMIWKFRNCPA